jgi:hypothetical protein
MLLAPDAVKVTPKVRLGSQYVTDFVLELARRQYVLVEIEAPRHPILRASGERSARLSHALRQVEDWQQWLYENIAYARTDPSLTGIDDPEFLIVIGRQPDSEELDKKVARINRNLHRIKIVSYDDLLARLRQHLENLRRHSRHK